MRLHYKGHDYLVEFQYELDKAQWARSNEYNGLECKTSQPNITICTIFKGNKGQNIDVMDPVLTGKALRSVTDQFVKETGRKTALARALILADNGKDFRAAVWKAYFARRHK